jgi:hypothetical protein
MVQDENFLSKNTVNHMNAFFSSSFSALLETYHQTRWLAMSPTRQTLAP